MLGELDKSHLCSFYKQVPFFISVNFKSSKNFGQSVTKSNPVGIYSSLVFTYKLLHARLVLFVKVQNSPHYLGVVNLS